jgi:hypothetical protein
MSILFAPKYRWLVPISVALLIAFAVGLWLTNNAPVYGQAAAARIPDLRGRWQGEIIGYMFDNALSPTDSPTYVRDSSPEQIIDITVQTGRVFAGSSPDGGKLTGVLLPDGTIRIHGFGEGNLRIFATCTLRIEKGRYVLTGTADMFDDLHDGVDAPDMATFLIRTVKLN